LPLTLLPGGQSTNLQSQIKAVSDAVLATAHGPEPAAMPHAIWATDPSCTALTQQKSLSQVFKKSPLTLVQPFSLPVIRPLATYADL
jgi:hypothetical protein